LTRVLADDLESDHVSSLIEFMRSASEGTLAQRGKRIEIKGLTNKEVKFLLRKFLHANSLSDYGVLHTASIFEIVRIRPDQKQTENEILKTRTPFVPIRPPPTAVKPSLRIEWQGRPPTKRTRHKA